jgi:hypothetical protein
MQPRPIMVCDWLKWQNPRDRLGGQSQFEISSLFETRSGSLAMWVQGEGHQSMLTTKATRVTRDGLEIDWKGGLGLLNDIGGMPAHTNVYKHLAVTVERGTALRVSHLQLANSRELHPCTQERSRLPRGVNLLKPRLNRLICSNRFHCAFALSQES